MKVEYEGDTEISGVPGTGAPIKLNFLNIVGSKTNGKLLPTGNVLDNIKGVEVTLIDCAMPIVIAEASAMGKTGQETKEELEKDAAFFERLEEIRLIAGQMMGLGNVAGRVIPKFAIVAPPEHGGTITARYFVPTAPHASMAVTGGISISACCVVEGTLANRVAVTSKPKFNPRSCVYVVIISFFSILSPSPSKVLQVPSTNMEPIITHMKGRGFIFECKCRRPMISESFCVVSGSALVSR